MTPDIDNISTRELLVLLIGAIDQLNENMEYFNNNRGAVCVPGRTPDARP